MLSERDVDALTYRTRGLVDSKDGLGMIPVPAVQPIAIRLQATLSGPTIFFFTLWT